MSFPHLIRTKKVSGIFTATIYAQIPNSRPFRQVYLTRLCHQEVIILNQ